MATRIELQNKLEELLGEKHVYYQPPSKMEYPAIKYSKSMIDTDHADNIVYRMRTKYELIIIDKRPDNSVIQKLLALSYCSYNRHYESDNLHHDVLTIYW